MDNLYDIIFQSNGEFHKVRIHYNVIHDLCIMHHMNHLCMLDLAFFYKYIQVYDARILHLRKSTCTRTVCLRYAPTTYFIFCNWYTLATPVVRAWYMNPKKYGFFFLSLFAFFIRIYRFFICL
jgi:hypothetical protein